MVYFRGSEVEATVKFGVKPCRYAGERNGRAGNIGAGFCSLIFVGDGYHISEVVSAMRFEIKLN